MFLCVLFLFLILLLMTALNYSYSAMKSTKYVLLHILSQMFNLEIDLIQTLFEKTLGISVETDW